MNWLQKIGQIPATHLSPVLWYHGTDSLTAYGLLQEMVLRPRSETGETSYHGGLSSIPTSVYLTSNPGKAAKHALERSEQYRGTHPVVLVIRPESLGYVHVDEDLIHQLLNGNSFLETDWYPSPKMIQEIFNMAVDDLRLDDMGDSGKSNQRLVLDYFRYKQEYGFAGDEDIEDEYLKEQGVVPDIEGRYEYDESMHLAKNIAAALNDEHQREAIQNFQNMAHEGSVVASEIYLIPQKIDRKDNNYFATSLKSHDELREYGTRIDPNQLLMPFMMPSPQRPIEMTIMNSNNWLTQLYKIANTTIREDNAMHIFDFIRAASKAMSSQPTARVAGGWVRDQLLGIPSNDIDITIDNMTGIEFAEAMKKFAAEDPRYRDQRVIGAVKTTEERPEQIKNLAVSFLSIFGQDIEILNLRGNEIYEEGNRNPISVEAATPEGDAARRDLTLNALFYNINTQQVEDFTGKGLQDLKTLTLRTPLDPIKTFRDDPLRLLRILRFYSRYEGSEIAPEVMEALHDPSVQHQITRKIINPDDPQGIVVERTADEMRKIMIGNQPEKALKIMYETGLLGGLLNLPESFHPLNMDQQTQHHALTVIDHALEVLGNANQLSKKFGLDDKQRMMINFAALGHDLGKLDPRTHYQKPGGDRGYFGDPSNPERLTHEQSGSDVWKSFAKALKLSDEEYSTVHDLISSHMRPHGHVDETTLQFTAKDPQLRRYIRQNPSWVFQYIHAMADAMSKTDSPDESRMEPYQQGLDRLYELAPNADDWGNQAPAQDLLNGTEIMSVVGLPAKPPMGLTGYIEIVKERIREEQDINPAMTQNDAVAIVQGMVQSGELDVYRTASSGWLRRILCSKKKIAAEHV